jgi:hypothetical protein
MADDLITVACFLNEIEAQLARGFLKNSGIKAFIIYDAGGKYAPSIYIHQCISLKVHTHDASRAMKLLRPKQSSSLKASDYFSKNREFQLSFFAELLIVDGIFLLIYGSEEQFWLIIGIGLVIAGMLLWVRVVGKGIVE